MKRKFRDLSKTLLTWERQTSSTSTRSPNLKSKLNKTRRILRLWNRRILLHKSNWLPCTTESKSRKMNTLKLSKITLVWPLNNWNRWRTNLLVIRKLFWRCLARNLCKKGILWLNKWIFRRTKQSLKLNQESGRIRLKPFQNFPLQWMLCVERKSEMLRKPWDKAVMPNLKIKVMIWIETLRKRMIKEKRNWSNLTKLLFKNKKTGWLIIMRHPRSSLKLTTMINVSNKLNFRRCNWINNARKMLKSWPTKWILTREKRSQW